VLCALDARIQVAGPGGTRELPVASFHAGFMETVLAPDELVTQVIIPVVPGRRAAYARFTPGSADDYPTVSAAASIVRGDDLRVSGGVLALGGVSRVPLLVSAAATLTAIGDIAAVAEAAAAASEPTDDQRGSARYKKAMAREWSARVLRACLNPEHPPEPGLVAG
jgi:aerobic carbon-monoxide dehydrogenase medium subunit